MLGPLPRLHRIVIVVAALTVCVGLGLWLGVEPHVPVLVGSGAALGALTGVAMAWLLVHEPHRARADLRHRRR